MWKRHSGKRKPPSYSRGQEVLKEALTAVEAYRDQIMLQSLKLDKSFFDVWPITMIVKYTMKILFIC